LKKKGTEEVSEGKLAVLEGKRRRSRKNRESGEVVPSAHEEREKGEDCQDGGENKIKQNLILQIKKRKEKEGAAKEEL